MGADVAHSMHLEIPRHASFSCNAARKISKAKHVCIYRTVIPFTRSEIKCSKNDKRKDKLISYLDQILMKYFAMAIYCAD